jgi:hypothetical protein
VKSLTYHPDLCRYPLDRHFTGDASLDASASLPFQNHNNGYGEAARSQAALT